MDQLESTLETLQPAITTREEELTTETYHEASPNTNEIYGDIKTRLESRMQNPVTDDSLEWIGNKLSNVRVALEVLRKKDSENREVIRELREAHHESFKALNDLREKHCNIVNRLSDLVYMIAKEAGAMPKGTTKEGMSLEDMAQVTCSSFKFLRCRVANVEPAMSAVP